MSKSLEGYHSRPDASSFVRVGRHTPIETTPISDAEKAQIYRQQLKHEDPRKLPPAPTRPKLEASTSSARSMNTLNTAQYAQSRTPQQRFNIPSGSIVIPPELLNPRVANPQTQRARSVQSEGYGVPIIIINNGVGGGESTAIQPRRQVENPFAVTTNGYGRGSIDFSQLPRPEHRMYKGLKRVALVGLLLAACGGGEKMTGAGRTLVQALQEHFSQSSQAVLAAKHKVSTPEATITPKVKPTEIVTPVPLTHANLVDGYYNITTEFGHYPDVPPFKGSPHYGLDFSAWTGTIIHMPEKGTITEVTRGCSEGDLSCGKGWGNHVWYKSAERNDYVGIFHFSKIDDWVKDGVEFKPGEDLGESGNTGYSFGPHIHVQENPKGMQNDGSQNPAWVLPWLHCPKPNEKGKDMYEPVIGAQWGRDCFEDAKP